MVGIAPDRRTDYSPALKSVTAARRLHVIATWWIIFVILSAAAGLAGVVVAIIREHSTDERYITGATLFGIAFWTVGGLLIGLAAQAYSRDVEARAPWVRS